MSYKKEQYRVQAEFFKGKCGGQFNRNSYSFVLAEPYRAMNLYPAILAQAVDYFQSNRIHWWRGKGALPTNHTLSSQVACVNHLLWAMRNARAASAILQVLDPDFNALPYDTGNYVEFEYNGCEANHGHNLLGERGITRGSNTTSLDACMLAEKNGKRTIVCIEWKYVETYNEQVADALCNARYTARKATYAPHLLHPESPLMIDAAHFEAEYTKFAVEPFYQLMRQTLWAWLYARENPHRVTDYLHVHVIPHENVELLNCRTSPEIATYNICDGWKRCLKQPNKYVHVSPRELIEASTQLLDPDLHGYLNARYWQNAR